MDDLISRQAAIDALDSINCCGYVEGSWDIVRGIIEDVPSAHPENQVHLCDSCRHVFPECPCEKDDVIFGNGKGNDNICACNKYEPSVQPEQRWIPVTEMLPEEHDSIFNRFYGTERFTKAMWRKQSDKVIVTELFEDGTMRTSTACTHDGEWYFDVKFVKREIIAWMPLPEPYKEGEK